MLRCVIIDDEPLALKLLVDYVEKTEFLELKNSFTNPIEGLHFISSNEVDLVFLDIQMPELTGIQFMKIMKSKCQFIMTTAYNQYAIDGYEFDVIDFLLKPITFDRFLIAANKAKERIEEKPTVSESNKEQDPNDNFIFVKSEYRVQKIDFDSINYLEGMGDYVNIVTEEGRILTLESIKSFVERLPSNRFMRVHKSFIISFEKIKFIERNRVQIKEKLIPVSNSYQKQFWERVNSK